jgi:hypothetical protein
MPGGRVKSGRVITQATTPRHTVETTTAATVRTRVLMAQV